MAKIFICYRRKDSDYPAAHLYKVLCDNFGPDSIVLDVDSVPLGADWREYLNNQVNQCNVLLAVIGDKWLELLNEHPDDEPDFVLVEIEAALKRDIPVVPILVQEASIPMDTDLPKEIAALHWRNAAEMRGGTNLPLHLERIVDRLKKMLSNQAANRQVQITRNKQATGRKAKRDFRRTLLKLEPVRQKGQMKAKPAIKVHPKSSTGTNIEIEVPAHLRYTHRHAWILLTNDVATVGYTAFLWSVQPVLSVSVRFLKDVGEKVQTGDLVVALDLVGGDQSYKDKELGFLGDKTIYVRAPVAGEIRELNKKLRPGLFSSGGNLIQDDPYGDGWAFRMHVNTKGESEAQQLMEAKEYRSYLQAPEFGY